MITLQDGYQYLRPPETNLLEGCQQPMTGLQEGCPTYTQNRQPLGNTSEKVKFKVKNQDALNM
jgi:hypothetical protein